MANLSFLVWTPEFELGIPEIDAQHSRLLERVNAFAHAFTDGAGATTALSALLHEAARHFDFEEAMMRQAAYLHAAVHAEQHSELLASMERLLARLIHQQHEIDRVRTLDFLRDWFSIHILRADADLARHLKGQTAAQTA